MKLVFVTAPPDAAGKLIRTLVEERLVACGNVVSGVRSTYWWEGKVCDDEESIVLMETADDRLDAMIARLREIHPYQVPKIVALDPGSVNADYLAWCTAETRPR